mmetsp:Transcript_13639/g.35021  ORF Transcript_13639/g.35021 Transcript_13639/m.35021 type:complete len:233 (+) Transcript_13639:179-877(+)
MDVSLRRSTAICALRALMSLACALTSCTRRSRSAISFRRRATGSLKRLVCVVVSLDSSDFCCLDSLVTVCRHCVLSAVSASICSWASSILRSHCRSSCANVALCALSCSCSSSAPRVVPMRSSSSKSISCPNLSICTLYARASNSAMRASLAFLSRSSCWCSFRSSCCCRRSATFSWSSSLMRLLSFSSSVLLNTSAWLRSYGSFPSTRYSIWCMLSVTTTSISLSLPCFSF